MAASGCRPWATARSSGKAVEEAMLFGFSKTQYSPIAIDFGADNVKVLQVVLGDPPQIVAAGAASIPESARKDPAARNAFYTDALATLIKEQGFKGRRAICSIPAYQTLLQNFQVSRGENDDMDSQVGVNLRQRLNVDPGRMVVRNFLAGAAVGIKQEVVCVAASRDAVLRYIEIARRVKVDVVGMHCEPVAMLKAFSHLYRRDGEEKRTTCFIDLGAATTKMVIAHGADMVFAKAIHAAGDHLTRTLAQSRSMSFHEAREMRWNSAGDGAATATLEAKAAAPPGPPAAATPPRTGLAILDAQTSERPTPVVDKHKHMPDADTVECLVDELQLCVRYHQSVFADRPIEKIVFVGGESRHVDICQRIARSLRIGAQLGDPLARLVRVNQMKPPTGVDMRLPQPGWAVPVGLCLCESNL
jgi:Tfp pilus assembly PilM family ATPase